jgi:hypothetical protein
MKLLALVKDPKSIARTLCAAGEATRAAVPIARARSAALEKPRAAPAGAG